MAMAKDMPEEKRKRYIRPFFTDMEFMNRIAGWMNELPEAITCGQREFADWLELFMMSAEAESTRYVIRLQAWYIHFCCVEELLTMCRLLQKLRLEHLDPIRNRMIHYFREARQLCGMPSLPSGRGDRSFDTSAGCLLRPHKPQCRTPGGGTAGYPY